MYKDKAFPRNLSVKISREGSDTLQPIGEYCPIHGKRHGLSDEIFDGPTHIPMTRQDKKGFIMPVHVNMLQKIDKITV